MSVTLQTLNVLFMCWLVHPLDRISPEAELYLPFLALSPQSSMQFPLFCVNQKSLESY